MARVITQRTLRNESGEIMRRLEDGKSFIVTRNGAPVAELVPLRRQRFVKRAAVLATFSGAPEIDLERLRDDLDSLASQEIEPRG